MKHLINPDHEQIGQPVDKQQNNLVLTSNFLIQVIYGSTSGFHAVDLDSASVYDVYLPKHATGPITPHTIVMLPNSNGMQLLLCYDNEGVYVNTYGKVRVD